jgi:hypothetical protein
MLMAMTSESEIFARASPLRLYENYLQFQKIAKFMAIR